MRRAEDYFERAQGYAVAALPYFYRRLGSVKCPVKVLSTVERVPDGMEEARSKVGSKDSPVIRAGAPLSR
jgi:hypothetical protein